MMKQNVKTSTAYKLQTPWLLISLRIAIGWLFFFSGILKANDPIGLSEKMQEILHSWNILWFDSISIYAALIIICAEVLIGISLILSFHIRLMVTISWILVGFFTLLTGIAKFSGTVDTCGCFGDCIPLSTNQSFIKNCILFVLLGVLFWYRNQFSKTKFKRSITLSLLIIFSSATLFTSWWAMEHLPFLDCSVYKKGTHIEGYRSKSLAQVPAIHETFLMKDLRTGDTTSWDGLTFHHWKISQCTSYEWLNQDETLDSLAAISPSYFSLYSTDMVDFTNIILKDPGYNFLLLIKDVEAASTHDFKTIRDLMITATKNNIGFYIVSSSSEKATNIFLEEQGIQNADILYMSMLTNQQIIRTNPGLIILKSGTILGKWGFNEYPNEIEWKNENAIKVK